MRRLAHALAAVLLTAAPATVLATGLAPAAPAEASSRARPGVSVEPARAAAGTSARVRGSGWTPGATVQVQVCGARAVHGSADCDTGRGVTAMVAPTGSFEAGLTVGAPPSACPCVIRAGTLPGGAAAPANATAPFTVQGHPVRRIERDVAPVRADVVGVELVGGGERGELFGGRTERTLVLRIRNAGADPIENAPLVVGWGGGDEPDTPLTAPETGVLRPGETATYRVPVELPRASFGTFVVGGRYAGQVPFETSFSTYPWGLLGVNLLAAMLLLLGIRLALGRRAARRRRRRLGAVPPALGAATAAGQTPAHHRAAPSPAGTVEIDDLIGYLDTTARSPSGAYVVDRDALVGYLEERRGGELRPVDVEALERFLSTSHGEAR
ncbi:hypothetical protein [Actinomadura sp. 7K507]|uniref:hypothetical protein n=1 Tax=Actinomadura sp. 7K507 TaxID=2530365 RepID=UPI00104F7B35|nr:hypothetical protein [Actinomadura sp. 7K507]TDC73606.1 hypothetical protein E1285_44515 [Actinomadura sp. 7K507]